MPVYVVSYDLTRPGQNYEGLWAELERIGGKPVLLSQWVVNVNQTAEELLEVLRSYTDPTDRLLVMARDNGDFAAITLRTRLKDFK